MNITDVFGHKIKKLRETNKLTQSELAEAADLSLNFLARIERGEAVPSIITLDKLAKAFGLKLHELLNFEEPVSTKQPNPVKLIKLYNNELLKQLSTYKSHHVKKALKVAITSLKEFGTQKGSALDIGHLTL